MAAKNHLTAFAPLLRAPTRKALGGAKPKVQTTADLLVETGAPMLVARIYASSSMRNMESDPRYDRKTNTVENIYLPAQETVTRSGVQQIWNWLTKGRLE